MKIKDFRGDVRLNLRIDPNYVEDKKIFNEANFEYLNGANNEINSNKINYYIDECFWFNKHFKTKEFQKMKFNPSMIISMYYDCNDYKFDTNFFIFTFNNKKAEKYSIPYIKEISFIVNEYKKFFPTTLSIICERYGKDYDSLNNLTFNEFEHLKKKIKEYLSKHNILEN